MTLHEPLERVSETTLDEDENMDLIKQTYGFHSQRIEECGLTIIWPPEGQTRCIPVRWLKSQGREIPVVRNEEEH